MVYNIGVNMQKFWYKKNWCKKENNSVKKMVAKIVAKNGVKNNPKKSPKNF